MPHPITKSLQPINPPLEPGEILEVYFAAADKKEPLRRHAFGIVIYRSGQEKPIEIAPPPSLSPDTHAQRGNLGAVITIFEWLELNQAQDHDVTIYTVEEYIRDLEGSSQKKGSKLKDLYARIVPILKAWPRVRFLPLNDLRDVERRERALKLARDRVEQLFPPISKPRKDGGRNAGRRSIDRPSA